ncbi:hypothetical protein BDB01DRAFT_796235 [Pilobolus umbonatus]|nr:hypothetical protein BDB01DRAFT_796235 [Pilobolus umbonatus]
MSYISSLNLLNADSPLPIHEEYQDDLSLWANAQFSFDTTPGTALVEEDSKEEALFQTLTELNHYVQPPLDSMYYRMPSTIQDTTPTLPRIAPAPGPAGLMDRKRLIPEEDEAGDELAADDDKRRRNTAASARFRMKKKLREQALEMKTKEMSDNVNQLESKVKELEMEAQWLRALVLEKDPTLLSKLKK